MSIVKAPPWTKARRGATSLAALLASLLSACGGGGGGGTHIPAAPTQLTVTPVASDLELDWSPSGGATSYNVYGDVNPGVSALPALLVTTVPAPSPSERIVRTLVSVFAPGTTAYFVVTAVNSLGESPPSNEASNTVGGTPDPLFQHQWHLENTGQAGGTPGEDIRVLNAWSAGIAGDGVRFAFVDDGLEIAHEDLVANVAVGLSHNYLNGSSNPTGGEHGTSCAGVSAAVRMNGKGGTGAAFRANMVGYNLLQALTTVNEADAMTRNAQDIWISSNSWGATDGLGVPQPSNQTWRNAVQSGLSSGRNGLGTIYVWAAGNGALTNQGLTDDSNLDGQANFYGVIAIAAVGDDGKKANYSEEGANVWVAAPSRGHSNHGITTVDRTGTLGYNDGTNPFDYPDVKYTNTFSGTSSATPLAGGVVALALAANPALTWRDLRLVLAGSARKNDASDSDWTVNGAGHPINHKYGFGVADAEAAVLAAQGWSNVGALVVFDSLLSQPNLPIPDADPTGVSDSIVVAGSGVQNIEFVRILFDAADHTFSADLEIVLTAPSGTQSKLARFHAVPSGPQPYVNWIFGDVRHLDEPADGTWTLTVRDLASPDTGTFRAWQLEFLGH
jgi:subtilisin family serine protease